jgi:uncharacterized protein (TIGR02271 family)
MTAEPSEPGSPAPAPSEVEVVPLFEETVSAGKREVEQGRIRVSVRVRDGERILEEVLRHQTADVERVAINCPVETIPAPRNEGNVLIIPLVREEVVVIKRYILTEEIRIHLREEVRHERIPVTLKSEEARFSAAGVLCSGVASAVDGGSTTFRTSPRCANGLAGVQSVWCRDRVGTLGPRHDGWPRPARPSGRCRSRRP